MDLKQVIQLRKELQSWCPDADTEYLYEAMAKLDPPIPFCEECADWHFKNSPHSTTDSNKG